MFQLWRISSGGKVVSAVNFPVSSPFCSGPRTMPAQEYFDEKMAKPAIANLALPDNASFYNGHHYKPFRERKTWEQAQAHAKSLGGHVAVPKDMGESNYIRGLVNGWFGITDKNRPGVWSTVTGQKAFIGGKIYVHRGARPGPYISIAPNGTWYKVSRNDTRPYVVEWEY